MPDIPNHTDGTPPLTPDPRRYGRIIMGIDPGTNVMGYALLGIDGRRPELIVMGVLKLNRMESHYLRLRRIHERVLGLVEQYLPDELSIEAPFCGKNVQSMLKLGRAQGVAMAAALSRDIPIAEYTPTAIKQAVAGHGGAGKEQVAAMLMHILDIPRERMPHLLDATDALAAALTHYYESARPGGGSALGSARKSTWERFLADHPDRLAPRRK